MTGDGRLPLLVRGNTLSDAKRAASENRGPSWRNRTTVPIILAMTLASVAGSTPPGAGTTTGHERYSRVDPGRRYNSICSHAITRDIFQNRPLERLPGGEKNNSTCDLRPYDPDRSPLFHEPDGRAASTGPHLQSFREGCCLLSTRLLFQPLHPLHHIRQALLHGGILAFQRCATRSRIYRKSTCLLLQRFHSARKVLPLLSMGGVGALHGGYTPKAGDLLPDHIRRAAANMLLLQGNPKDSL